MRNQIELLSSGPVRAWIKQYGGVGFGTHQQLMRYQHALLTLAKSTQTGNIPADTLPIGNVEEFVCEAPLVLQQFQRFINCQSFETLDLNLTLTMLRGNAI